MEQEYVLYKDSRPLGWPANGFPEAQGPFYCASGPLHAFGRQLAMKHYQTCIRMGLKLSGTNAEVMPGQWEYQVGPCTGVEAGDHAVMARWVYLRVLEDSEGAAYDFNVQSKPVRGDWNGSGMHTNFSTKAMRADGGFKVIEEALNRLSKTFFKDIACYGADNIERLSGHHETSRLDQFNFDVGTRHTSCRIPNQTKIEKKGYFEDRRPSASADPYLVSARLFASSCNIPSPSLDAYIERTKPDWLKKMEATTTLKTGEADNHH